MGRLGVLGVAAIAAVLAIGQTAHAQSFSVSISVDENGNGSFSNSAGFTSSLPSALQNDPGPGGSNAALTYSLLSPPGLTAGDLLIDEPGTGLLGDVVRFNPDETCTDGSVGCLVFYSASPPVDSLADSASFPSVFYSNQLTLTEDLTGQLFYTPTAGEPGFVAGAAGPVTFDIISDAVPEPASLALFASALIGFGALRRRKRR